MSTTKALSPLFKVITVLAFVGATTSTIVTVAVEQSVGQEMGQGANQALAHTINQFPVSALA